MPDRYLGRSIGKYRVTRLLGTGAFAWVYEAVDQDLEIPVAIKILRPEFSGHDTAEGRFRREASTAARLRHPNIVTVRDVGQTDGTAYVVMDLYPVTLGRRLSLVDHLSETDTIRIGIGVAAALSIAHANGIIHRDIKPDNILIDNDGEAVVADFGLARALAIPSGMSATNQVLGTPHYFSPEQARGQELDGRSDLYSLGVTLYHTATGRLPFDGDDWYSVARRHIEDTPVPPRKIRAELTPGFERIVQRLLSKNPIDRYGSALEVVDALAGLPTAPQRTTATHRVASHTIEAFMPARASHIGWWLAAGTVVLAWAGWAYYQQRAPLIPPPGLTATDTTAVTTDSSRVSTTTPTATDTQSAQPPPRPGRTGTTSGGRTPQPVPVAYLELSAPDSAELYVDHVLVGSGSWSGERQPASPLSIRAVLPNAAVACETAARDTVLDGLRVGQRITLELPVRDCAIVRYLINPRDARVSFTPLDGGRPREVRADSAAAMSIPVGRYLLRVSAPRCSTFQDTIQIVRTPDGTPITLNLICA